MNYNLTEQQAIKLELLISSIISEIDTSIKSSINLLNNNSIGEDYKTCLKIGLERKRSELIELEEIKQVFKRRS
jgi:hypothetical protein